MVIDHKNIIDYIVTFLANYQKKANVKNFCIPFNNSASSGLAVILCEIAHKMCGGKIFVLSDPINFFEAKNIFEIAIPIDSKTRVNVEKEINLSNSTLLISPFDRISGQLLREYNKYNDAADLYPLLDLYPSEIINMLDYLRPNHLFNKNFIKDYELLEWVDRENVVKNIISSDELPNHNQQWFKYTKKQKEMIAKLHQREKMTRHKIINQPFCKIRHLEGVR